jgi:hypothetical protein
MKQTDTSRSLEKEKIVKVFRSGKTECIDLYEEGIKQGQKAEQERILKIIDQIISPIRIKAIESVKRRYPCHPKFTTNKVCPRDLSRIRVLEELISRIKEKS